MADPRISVIVPHMNQPDALGRCLASLAAQSIGVDAFEVIVVDNGSRDDCSGVVAGFDGGRLLHEPEPGPGPARNTGVAAARGAILAFVDADCRAHPGWLSAAVAGLEAAGSQDVVGGDVRIDVGDAQRLTPLEAYESVFAYRQKMYIARDGFSGTGNLAMRRERHADVGPFAGIAIAEDRDWGQRARAMGIGIGYVPDMVVYHPARRTMAELQQKWQRHIAHDLASHRAANRPGWLWNLKSAAMIASIVPHAAMLLTSDRLSGLANRLRGIGVLAQIRVWRAVEMRRQARGFGESEAAGWNRG